MPNPLAITRNRQALLSIVAAIVALLGDRDGLFPRGVRRAAMALLRSAESAVRRLIVIATQGLALPPEPARPFPAGLAGAWGPAGGAKRRPAFRLFDPPQQFARMRPAPPAGVPRIRSFGGFAPLIPLIATPPAPVPRPEPAATVDAGPLLWRLAALQGALADLPRQARRLARWRARRQARCAERSGAERLRSRPRRCAAAGRRAGAQAPAIRSSACCASAMRSRSTRWLSMRGRGPTRPDAPLCAFFGSSRSYCAAASAVASRRAGRS